MKQMRWLLGILLCLAVGVFADNYIDDVYYSPALVVLDEASQESKVLTPYYNLKEMEEIVFVEDTMAVVVPKDTVF